MENLNLGQHISQQFNEELEDVRSKVLQMGGIVEDQLSQSVRALVEGDIETAAAVVENDYRINALNAFGSFKFVTQAMIWICERGAPCRTNFKM